MTTPVDAHHRFAWAHAILLVLIPPASVVAVQLLLRLGIGWAALGVWVYFTLLLCVNAVMARSAWREIGGHEQMPAIGTTIAAAVAVQLLLIGTADVAA
jgi:hypothetical protein